MTDDASPRRKGPLFKRFFKPSRKKNGNGNSQAATLSESLEELLEVHEEHAEPLDAQQKMLLTNIFKLNAITAEDICVPRADVIAVDIATKYETVVALMAESAHSRLPVFRKTLDDVLGMIHIKDILIASHQGEDYNFKELIRPIIFIPPSMKVLDVLLKMREKQTHMALIVDEFGGIDGLLTIEDVVEQIVGEIEDEHDIEEEPELYTQDDGRIVADARVDLAEFEAFSRYVINPEDKEDLDTLGGLIVSVVGRVPARGEIVHITHDLEAEILDADPRRIKRVRVKMLHTGPSALSG